MLKVQRAIAVISFLCFAWLVQTILFYVAGASSRHDLGLSTYNALQLFFANVSASEFPAWECVSSAQAPCLTSRALIMSRYLLPWSISLIALLTFVSAIRGWIVLKLRRWLASVVPSKTPFVFIVGLGNRGMTLVRAARGVGADVVVLEKDGDNPRVGDAHKLGARVWEGDATNAVDLRLCLWKQPSAIYLMSDSSDTNLAALALCKRFYDNETASAARTLIHVSMPDIVQRQFASQLPLLNSDTESCWTSPVNVDDDAAAYLSHCVQQTHPFKVTESPLRVLIIGLAPATAAIARQLIKTLHVADARSHRPALAEIVAITSDEENRRNFDAAHPLLYAVSQAPATEPSPTPHNDIYPIVHWTSEVDSVSAWTYADYAALRGATPFTHCFVALESGLANAGIADRIAKWEAHARGSNRGAAVVAIGTLGSTPFANSLSQDIVYFDPTDAYSMRALQWRQQLRRLAVAINYCYAHFDQIRQSVNDVARESALYADDDYHYYALAILQDEQLPQDHTQQDSAWTRTSQADRHSSLAQAQHIDVKLGLLGYAVDWTGSQDPLLWREVQQQLVSHIHMLAECEHRRWNAHQLLEGFSWGAIKNKEASIHPDLVPYDALSPAARSYDVGFVLNIPALLRLAGLGVCRR